MIFRALAAKPAGRRDPGSMKYQRILDMRGRDAADSYAKRTAENAIAFVQANPPIKDRTDAMIRILELEALADSLPWMIYAGPGARRALEGAFTVAERVGRVCGRRLPTSWRSQQMSAPLPRSRKGAPVVMGAQVPQ